MKSKSSKNSTERRPMRVGQDSYIRLKEAAELKKIPMSFAIDSAISLFADSVLFSYDNLKNKLELQDSLSLKFNKELLLKSFEKADMESCEALIKFIDNNENIQFENLSMDKLEGFVKKVKDKDMKILHYLRVNVKNKPEEINEEFPKVMKILEEIGDKNEGQILFDTSFENENPKIAFFIFLKNKNKENHQG